MCKDFGVKQALIIGGGAEPIGDYLLVAIIRADYLRG